MVSSTPASPARPGGGRRRRADAEQNIARIVKAARSGLGANPALATDDIARAAGVGRMTLYGHFRTRADLVEAALVDALKAGEETLSALDLTGDARQAMIRLLESSWSLVAESSALLTAAQGVLPASQLRELHTTPAQRMEALIRRGKGEGAFRASMPIDWLVSLVQYILHGAAEEVRAGRVEESEAADLVQKSVLSVLDA
jgi:AcrR family transcriptional regulator